MTAALTTAITSLVVAVIAGGIALWNRRKTNEQAVNIESLKSAFGKDLARLNAKLLHGQLISSTQWNAEFAAYRSIWKEMVAVRTLAPKVVHRESELKELGVPADYLDSVGRLQLRKDLLMKYAEAAQALLLAIHNNAPFYPAPIREAANTTHGKVKDLLDKHMAAFVRRVKGVDVTVDPQFVTEDTAVFKAILEGVDNVESLIRNRLSDVQVVNSVTINE